MPGDTDMLSRLTRCGFGRASTSWPGKKSRFAVQGGHQFMQIVERHLQFSQRNAAAIGRAGNQDRTTPCLTLRQLGVHVFQLIPIPAGDELYWE